MYSALDRVNCSSHSLLPKEFQDGGKIQQSLLKNKRRETGDGVGWNNSLIVLLSTEYLF